MTDVGREAEKLVKTHQAAIEEIDQKISELHISRRIRMDLWRTARLTASGIDPCRTCGRHVSDPCNDEAGMRENGPWDHDCVERFR